MNNLIEIGLYLAYILLAFAFLSIIILSMYFTIVNFKKAKQGLIGIALLAVIFVVAYLISPADQGLLYDTMKIGPKASKLIGAGLFTTYFGFIAIIVVVLVAELSKLFK
jgi:Na+(H+)/acetate symporter ActP